MGNVILTEQLLACVSNIIKLTFAHFTFLLSERLFINHLSCSSHTHTHTHAHTHTHTLTVIHIHTQTQSFSLSLSHTLSLSHALSLSLPLCTDCVCSQFSV